MYNFARWINRPNISPFRIFVFNRISDTKRIRRKPIIFLGHGVDGGPGGAVVEAGAEVGVRDAEGVLLLLAGEAPAVGGQGRQAVGMAGAEGIVVALLLDGPGGVHDGPHTADMVRDVVIHGIGVGSRPADAPAAEGDALEGLRRAAAPGVSEGAGIVPPGIRGGVRRDLRPVGEICVVGLHGIAGLDLCRQVNQIVRRLQVIGGIGGDIAVDIIAVVASPVAGVGVREGRTRAGALVAGQRGDIAGAVVGDAPLGEIVRDRGGRGSGVVPGVGQAVGAVVGEAVGAGDGVIAAAVGPGPAADIAGITRRGYVVRTADGRGVVAQGHREDVRLAVAGALDSRARAEPALDVPGVGGGDGVQ